VKRLSGRTRKTSPEQGLLYERGADRRLSEIRKKESKRASGHQKPKTGPGGGTKKKKRGGEKNGRSDSVITLKHREMMKMNKKTPRNDGLQRLSGDEVQALMCERLGWEKKPCELTAIKKREEGRSYRNVNCQEGGGHPGPYQGALMPSGPSAERRRGLGPFRGGEERHGGTKRKVKNQKKPSNGRRRGFTSEEEVASHKHRGIVKGKEEKKALQRKKDNPFPIGQKTEKRKDTRVAQQLQGIASSSAEKGRRKSMPNQTKGKYEIRHEAKAGATSTPPKTTSIEKRRVLHCRGPEVRTSIARGRGGANQGDLGWGG